MQTLQYKGLSEAQVADSRRLHGSNLLTPPSRKPLWLQFLEKFRDPLIIILLIAGVLSIGVSTYEYCVLGHGGSVYLEPTGIFVAILLATGLSFIFETKAEKEFEILNRVSDEEPVQVIRRIATAEGERDVPMLTAKQDIVVGDIVILATGQEIPADGRLLEAVTLSIDESTLTGEPLCHKTTDEKNFDSEATYASNCVMRSTKVMEGHGVMEVTAVGDRTEYGHVHTMSHISSGKKTPLDQQFDRLGKVIAWSSYAIGVLIMVGRTIEWFVWHNSGDLNAMEFTAYLLQSMMIAVTLVVCAVPEGLPMAVTLSLAYSMRRMLKTNNLVRKMHACETMGATTVICTDKTGTLTQNRMRVNCLTPCPSPEERGVWVEGMAVNSTAVLDGDGNPIGNPTEGALLLWLKSQGEDYQRLRDASPRLAELPFSTERKLMGTMVKSAATGKMVLHVKGAPEIIAALCGMEMPKELTEWQSKAMRTLAFASLSPALSPVGRGDEWTARDIETLLDNAGETPFTWLGAVAISDPLREDVPGAVAECRAAGIEVKVVTGDTPATAAEIARQIGILPSETSESRGLEASKYIITGPEFAALSDEELLERVPQIRIIARARPMDKQRLVETLQRLGHVVAVTGDGTNDAPALNTADVGLSMGDGTAVAKESSDITIIDNSFASIGRAVMWGRSLYQNIQRFVMFQMTINVVACAVVLAGSFMDTVSPLSVTQMLWVNLIMDTFAAMALASLPPNQSVMKASPRRRTDFIISRGIVLHIAGIGMAFALLLIALLYRMQHVDSGGIGTVLFNIFTHAATTHRSLTMHEATLFFTTFVMLQFWNMFNARAFATGESALKLRGCKGFIFISSAIIIGQVLIVNCGGEMFNVEPITWTEWITIFVATSPVLWIGEIVRRHKA